MTFQAGGWLGSGLWCQSLVRGTELAVLLVWTSHHVTAGKGFPSRASVYLSVKSVRPPCPARFREAE